MGKVSIAGGAVVGEVNQTTTVLTPGSTITVDHSLGNIFTLSQTDGTAATLNATNVDNDVELILVVTTTGTTGETLTFGTNFKSTATLAVGTTNAKIFVVKFVGVNGKLLEVSRTAAQQDN